MIKIIAIDDEKNFLESLKRGLLTKGMKDVLLEDSSEKAALLFKKGEKFDLALIDITMPVINGIELLDIIKENSPETECIMITAIDDVKTAVNAMKKGAFDYLLKPVKKDELMITIERAFEKKKLYKIIEIGKIDHILELDNKEAFQKIITNSSNMIKIFKEAELHAVSNVPVMITGESGTGKELLAKAIHFASSRKNNVFAPVNMASITRSLFDAEFFGHTKGAFTGASRDRKGLLEHSSSGTLFLDEIGTLSYDLQGKLLRVIQDGEFIKIGTNTPRTTNARFITATNENLEDLIKKKEFRKDLYYRLKGGWFHLPPLRKRREDIPLLIEHFFKKYSDLEIPAVKNDDILEKLISYDYPGNIRELISIVQSSVNLSQGKSISLNDLPEQIKKVKKKSIQLEYKDSEILPLSEVEKNHIMATYNQTNKNKSQTATMLGIGLNTLRRKLESYGKK